MRTLLFYFEGEAGSNRFSQRLTTFAVNGVEEVVRWVNFCGTSQRRQLVSFRSEQ